jgi:HPt (histidine-containing phosphotransfer) domain-containing protein
MSGDRERCIEAGMDHYIAKPVAIATLVDAIERVAPGDLRGARKRSATRPSKRIDNSRTPASDTAVYDRDAVLKVLHNDDEAFRELSQMFLVDHKLMLDGIDQALYSGDMQRSAAIAHTLKGMLGNFAAKAASRAAHKFYVTTSHGSRDRAARTFETLKKELALLSEALQRDLWLAEQT